VSLLDILLVLARHKRLIVRTVLVFTLLGVTYAILAPEEFTSSATVVREAQTEGGSLPGGLSGGLAGGALSGLGVSLGGAASGLTPQAYPDVLTSREVRLAVVRDTFRFPDAEQPMTFVDYVNRPLGLFGTVLDYTLLLPWTLKGALGNFISGEPTTSQVLDTEEIPMLTENEHDALEAVEDMVVTLVNQETGLMSISVTARDPRLASDLTQSFVQHLTSRIRQIRTKKVRERLEFVQGRFQEAQEELDRAEDRLARFLERNQNPTTATLQFQRDRLQRQVSFKEQLFSELQEQLTQARLDLQRRQPVVTVVEQPAPPSQRSAPKRTLIVIFSVFLGGLLSMGGVVVYYVLSVKSDEEEKEKVAAVKDAIFEGVWDRN
jgi:uncharacterized protein involved in exopolysaccharide biosynthesis